MARGIAALGLFVGGIAITAVPALLMLPICLVAGTISFVIGFAAILLLIGKKTKEDHNRDESGDVGYIIEVLLGSLAVGVICLVPSLVPAGVGIGLSMIVAP